MCSTLMEVGPSFLDGPSSGKVVCMDDKAVSQSYQRPRVVDYGSLQELTAACANGGGGDAFTKGGPSFGVSNPVFKCKSA
jgi:hypothetical protein